jgi:hypothetical protein
MLLAYFSKLRGSSLFAANTLTANSVPVCFFFLILTYKFGVVDDLGVRKDMCSVIIWLVFYYMVSILNIYLFRLLWIGFETIYILVYLGNL